MSAITVEAPAKLNLHLKIGGRRPDGFHDIESLFLALAFGDTLYLETVPLGTSGTKPEISMNWQLHGLREEPPSLPLEENIILRAVSLFRGRTGFNQGVKVSVEKRIPLGGGLGGGSSDAAAALLALNRLAADGGLLNAAELAEMGASLGSDVPFFLYNAPAAWVAGRGEQIQPLELPESVQNLALVLVNPGFPSDTAAAYRLLDVSRAHLSPEESHTKAQRHKGHEGKKLRFPYILNHFTQKAPKETQDFQTATLCPLCPPCLCVRSFASPPREWPFFNDFLPVLAGSDKGIAYQRIIAELRELGADFAGLSGSGSTCFGVFSGHDQAESARKVLSEHWPFVIISFLLARSAIPCYNNK